MTFKKQQIHIKVVLETDALVATAKM